MVDVIQALQTSIEIVGRLRALAKKVEDVEFKMLLADLSNELADAKLEVANLKSELVDVRQKNAELSQVLEVRHQSAPIFDDSVYKFSGEEGRFCTACFDTKDKKVRVRQTTGPFTVFGKWECPSCNATYG